MRRVVVQFGRKLIIGYLVFIVYFMAAMSSTTFAQKRTNVNGDGQLLAWHDDYAKAMQRAEEQRKMLFILFVAADGAKNNECDNAHRLAIARPEIQEKLSSFVRLELPLDAKIKINGEEVSLLQLPAFDEMLGRQGMAVVDFASQDARCNGSIVSMFPLYRGRPFTAEQIGTMLDLPPGTLTQRTIIYAVRTHPEHPGSADGEIRDDLAAEAESHSNYQADIRLQGHHRWETRFHRIRSRLPGGLTATEVCAESWPGEGLLAAAIECVRCWRLSSGHWRAVREHHPCYGYDMKRGNNGIWYATGIFGKRR